jgi:hypothetical protein
MEITIKLLQEDNDATVSRLFIDGVFECFTLEDEFRAVKKWGETRIPGKRYSLSLYREGTMHAKYLKKYGRQHFGMIKVDKVPNFEGILFHTGNTDEDTAGCILLGQTWNCAGTIGRSERAYQAFYGKVVPYLMLGEEVWLDVQR